MNTQHKMGGEQAVPTQVDTLPRHGAARVMTGPSPKRDLNLLDFSHGSYR